MTALSAPVGDLTIGTALDPSGVVGDSQIERAALH